MNTKTPLEGVTKEDYEAFEEVRCFGKWNMFDPLAREASGLDRDTYLFIIENYEELQKEHD